ncbi:MAG: hypothetical protein MPN21_11390 [Thermoanaerobaculia bacterium]|nr:hypothetical protein [Thermoanaerobaculia bacterium]
MRRERAEDRRTQRGMSVVEVLVAASLLLTVAVGILALLTRSLQNNTRGWEATQTSNHARTALDQRLGEALTAPGLEIAAGSNERKNELFWSGGSNVLDNDDEEGWYDSESEAAGTVFVRRTEIVRQYNVRSLLGESSGLNDEGEYVFELERERIDTPLSGDVEPRFVHIKRIEVTIEGRRQGGALGAGQRLKSETYKSF